MNSNLTLTRGVAALGLALSIGACSGMLGLDANGNFEMTMQKAGSSLFGPAPGGQSETQNRGVSPDTVSSFKVTITAVQMLHAGTDSNAGSWSTVQLSSPVTVDLMALASDDDGARVVASGSAEAGTYARVRLVLSSPSIRFKGAVSFGIGGILQGNTDYAVEIANAPSGTIELAADVKVESSASSTGELHLVFDQNASLGSVSIGSNGSVRLNAVIGER